MKNSYRIHGKFFKLLVITGLISFGIEVSAQEYPFSLPANITATYNVQTGQKENFRNKLLGYNIESFRTEREKNFLRRFDPISIRFPHGIFSNHYQWQTDKYQKDSYDNGSHETVLTNYAAFKVGSIDHIKQLNDEKKVQAGKGYNMIWTYAINFDDAESCVARATQDINKGFHVEDIELGNELYFENQRANQTSTISKIGNRAQSVGYALKEKFPHIKISIPMTWRIWDGRFADYNRAIANDGKYFDAISIHAYLGADPEGLDGEEVAFANILTSRLTLEERVSYTRDNFAPGKPVWLSEWGVAAGDFRTVAAASCLGMADVFIYMSENLDIYETANWFAFNDPLNAMVEVDKETYTGPIYPLQRRGYLSVYEMVYDVFKDAKMYKGTMSTTKLNAPKGFIDGVTSRVVEKDGKHLALIVNLTNRPVNYVLKVNGANYGGSFKHEALVFNDLGTYPSRPIDNNPLQLIKEGSGTITLPPLSISKLTNLTIDPNAGVPDGYTFATNEGGTVNVSGTVNIAYGANGVFEILENVSSDTPCNNATFGDPIPGVAKSCYIKDVSIPTGGPEGYTFAAYEGGTVSVSGTVNIAYGADGVFEIFENISSDTPCNNTAFGDPIPGKFKRCYIKQVSTNPPSGSCSFGTPTSTGLPTIANGDYSNISVLENGPDVSNLKKFRIKWNAGDNKLTQFAFNTRNGNPSYYVDLRSKIQQNFRNSNPSVQISGSGIGVDGDYWVTRKGSDFVMVSKNGNYTLYFSTSSSQPSCSDKTPQQKAIATTVYPNPAQNFFTVNLGSEVNASIKVYNLMGQSVYETFSEGKQTLTISKKLTAGMYLIRITEGNGSITTHDIIVQ